MSFSCSRYRSVVAEMCRDLPSSNEMQLSIDATVNRKREAPSDVFDSGYIVGYDAGTDAGYAAGYEAGYDAAMALLKKYKKYTVSYAGASASENFSIPFQLFS